MIGNVFCLQCGHIQERYRKIYERSGDYHGEKFVTQVFHCIECKNFVMISVRSSKNLELLLPKPTPPRPSQIFPEIKEVSITEIDAKRKIIENIFIPSTKSYKLNPNRIKKQRRIPNRTRKKHN